ncbi:MAG TPA: energy transducer TonB [Lacunisphaera sp.]|jgi:outer membrane biosynthesis protein TonB
MNTGRTLFGFIAVLVVSTAVISARTTPVKIEQTVDGQFPASLEFTPITSGKARLMINVDADGKLADLMVISYSNEAFADEAASLLKRWRYSAATVDGKPVGVRLQLEIDFLAKGRIISLTAIETTNSLVDRIMPVQLVKRVCAPDELDHPLEVLQTVNPPNPGLAENASRSSGSTVLDFYVDEKGQARMPVVMEATNPRYAQAAVNALNQWKFSSPTRQGKPIAVRVQQEFIFPSS